MNGPLPKFLRPLTRPASRLYARAVAARNARFDRGVGVQHIDRPVISVGNITTGGTGKTPMVAWIAKQLVAHGHTPVIAMRGYHARAGEVSDEQAVYADAIPNVPVLAHPDRITALRSYFNCGQIADCVILDDGFQHRQLHRDLDLVLIDVTAQTFDDELLPAGHLREPLESLRRADAVIATRADYVEQNFPQRIAQYHGQAPLALASHRWTRVDVHAGGAMQAHPVQWLRGKRVLTMLGIGNPQAFTRQLQDVGAFVAVNIPCRDHERYDRAKLATARGLADGCDAMAITAKDWVKIRGLIDWDRWRTPIIVPHLELNIFCGEDALRERILAAANLSRSAAAP